MTLIISSLSSLPTHFLSLLPLLGKVAKCMEKLQRDFLWNEIGGEPKIHLVKWAKVCKPLQVGGLGIRHLGSFNSALLENGVKVWHGDRCFMEEGYKGKMWEYLGWLVYKKCDKSLWGQPVEIH